MPLVDYPDDLKPASWEKKKPALPADCDVLDQLKLLHKKHAALAWQLYEADWPKGIALIVDLQKTFKERERSWRSSTATLKNEAQELAKLAQRLASAKPPSKTTAEAAKDVPAAVKRYERDIDKAGDAFEQSFVDALALLEQQAADDAESDHLLLDTDELLQQLVRCKRDAQRKVHFGFVQESDKHRAVLALSLKTAGSKIFNILKKETGVATGSFGRAWLVDGTVLVLEQDKPLSGLVKKVRAAVKEAGFRVTKVVLYDEMGAEFERDDG